MLRTKKFLDRFSVIVISLVLGCLQVSCSSSGPKPGEGPGFSIFDPELTASELFFATQYVSGIDEDDVPLGDSVTQDCALGGSETMSRDGDIESGRGTLSSRYSDCGTIIQIREADYNVEVSGTESSLIEVSDTSLNITGDRALSFGGDLGFSVECTTEAHYSSLDDFLTGEGEYHCVFRDQDGNELVYDYIPPA